MIIATKFDLGQRIYRMTVSRTIEDRPCPACDGEGYITTIAADGSEHRVECPKGRYTYRTKEADTICHRGRIHVGQRHRPQSKPDRLTVGQIRVYAGAFPEEVVMCEETGVGSGTLHPVEPKPVKYTSRGHHYGIFATPEEAISWGGDVVAMCNRLLGVELLHDEALLEEKARALHDEGLIEDKVRSGGGS